MIDLGTGNNNKVSSPTLSRPLSAPRCPQERLSLRFSPTSKSQSSVSVVMCSLKNDSRHDPEHHVLCADQLGDARQAGADRHRGGGLQGRQEGSRPGRVAKGCAAKRWAHPIKRAVLHARIILQAAAARRCSWSAWMRYRTCAVVLRPHLLMIRRAVLLLSVGSGMMASLTVCNVVDADYSTKYRY